MLSMFFIPFCIFLLLSGILYLLPEIFCLVSSSVLASYKSSQFYLARNIFISLLFLNDTFSGYRILGQQLFSFSLLKISFYYYLASIVFVEKLAIYCVSEQHVFYCLRFVFFYIFLTWQFLAILLCCTWLWLSLYSLAWGLFHSLNLWLYVICWFVNNQTIFSSTIVYAILKCLHQVSFISQALFCIS